MTTRAQARRLRRVQLANKIKQLDDAEKDAFQAWVSAQMTPEVKRQTEQFESALHSRMRDIAESMGMRSGMKLPGPRLSERIQWIGAGILSGTIDICPHLRNSAPRPVVCVMAQDKVHCGCLTKTTDPVDDRENFTCDICREYHEEDCAPQVVVVGPLLIAFGLCTACRESELRPL